MFTSGKSDCEIVADLYADTLSAAIDQVPELVLHVGGHDTSGPKNPLSSQLPELPDKQDLKDLAKLLPFARSCKVIRLSGHLSDIDLDSLADEIQAGHAPKLTTVRLQMLVWHDNTTMLFDNDMPICLWLLCCRDPIHDEHAKEVRELVLSQMRAGDGELAKYGIACRERRIKLRLLVGGKVFR